MAKTQTHTRSEAEERALDAKAMAPFQTPTLPTLTSTGLSYLGDGLYAVFRLETQGERVVSQRVEKSNLDKLTALALKADLDGLETWGKR